MIAGHATDDSRTARQKDDEEQSLKVRPVVVDEPLVEPRDQYAEDAGGNHRKHRLQRPRPRQRHDRAGYKVAEPGSPIEPRRRNCQDAATDAGTQMPQQRDEEARRRCGDPHRPHAEMDSGLVHHGELRTWSSCASVKLLVPCSVFSQ